jgi:hypothetical protein
MSLPIYKTVSLSQQFLNAGGILLLVFFLAWITGCTLVPKFITKSTPSYDGNVQNSGMIGMTTNGYEVVSADVRNTFNELVATYSTSFYPPVKRDSGFTPYTNGTFLLDKQNLTIYLEMNLFRRNNLPGVNSASPSRVTNSNLLNQPAK